MAIRSNQLTNFKGQPYLTKSDLGIPSSAQSFALIGQDGNLKPQYNPTQILSMQNPSGLSGDDAKKDTDYSKIKFIGNCNVSYGANGQITIRIGDNLNCSLFNGKDGISTTTVTSSKSGDASYTLSSDYSSVSQANGSTSFSIFQSSDKITANCGSTASTTDGTTDGTNGNEVHFDTNTKGKFKVYIVEGNNTTATEYEIGPITGNGTYYPKDGSNNNITGISCVITNFGEQPKSNKGATGYAGNVNFTFTPSNTYSQSKAFKLQKIEMIQDTTVSATWNNSSTNGTYFYLKETTSPSTPTSADYTITASTTSESGITFLTTSSTVKPSAEGLANIGYPAFGTNKLLCNHNTSNAWFNSFNEESTGAFTTWTTVKDTTMSWTYSSTANLLAGTFENPQVVVNGININGSGSTVTSSKTDNKLWVHAGSISGSNITDNRWKSDFSQKQNLSSTDLSASGNNDLQVYQGLLIYPSVDYSSYNKDSATNPDYSTCQGDRYYYMKFSKAGSMPSGQIDVVATSDITSQLANGNIQFEIAKSASMTTLYNIVFNYNGGGIAGSNSTFGSTCAFKYTFGDGAANDYIWLKITMKKGCTAQIKNVLLNGGTIA